MANENTSWGGGIKPRTSFPKNGSDYDKQRSTNERTNHYSPTYIHKGVRVLGEGMAPLKNQDFTSPITNEQRDAR